MTPRLPIYRGPFPKGICCPECGQRTRIINTRGKLDGSVRRRHSCVDCEIRFTTYERVEPRKAA